MQQRLSEQMDALLDAICLHWYICDTYATTIRDVNDFSGDFRLDHV